MHKSRTVTCGIVTTIVIVVPVIAVTSRRSCYLYCCHHCKNVDNYRPNYKGNNIKDQGNMSFRLSPLQITICLSVTSLYRYIYIHKVVFTIIIYLIYKYTHTYGKNNGWYGTHKGVQNSNK